MCYQAMKSKLILYAWKDRESTNPFVGNVDSDLENCIERRQLLYAGHNCANRLRIRHHVGVPQAWKNENRNIAPL